MGARPTAGVSLAWTGGTRTVASRARALSENQTAVMMAGTALAALGAYAFQLLGGRALGPAAFAPLTVLWTVQVLVLMVALVPLEQLVIRRLELTGGRSAGLRADAPALTALLAACTAVVVAGAWLLRDRFLAGSTTYVLLAGLLVLGYAVFAVGRGYLAGRHRYRAYGLATAAEALLRLVLTAVALLSAPDGLLLAGAMVAAPFAVLLARPFRRTPSPRVTPPSEEAAGGIGEFLGPLMVANALSQAVLSAAPLAVAALGATPGVISVVFLTFALFRGPLWVVQSVVARVLPPFTALAARGELPALRRWAARLAVGGAAVAGLAWAAGLWLGPAVVGLLFGAEFTPPGPLAALVAGGMTLAAVVLCSTQILVALGQTARVVLGWSVALVVTVAATLLTPAAPAIQVGVGFMAGELTAVVAVTVLVLVARAPTVRAA